MKSYHLVCTGEPQNEVGTVYGLGSYEFRADDDVSAIQEVKTTYYEALTTSARVTLLDVATGRLVLAWRGGVAQGS
jgi:hypothetical protein